jgi:hypothetical protein
VRTKQGVVLEIQQEQEGEPFELVLDIEFAFDEHASVLRTVALSKKTQRFDIQIPAQPNAVSLDPRNQILMWIEGYGPKPK